VRDDTSSLIRGGTVATTAPSPTRVVLAEDDVLLREGLASLLERSGFQVVGQAGDATQLLALVRDRAPELVVVDIRMPPTYTTEGLVAAQVIRQEYPETAILVLSAHTEVEHAMALRAGGRRIGYLLKSRITDLEEFLDTLERIVRGGSVVDPAAVGHRGHGREARAQHPGQAGAAGDRRRPPQGPRSGHLPGGPLAGSFAHDEP
jgi:DNA-binding NarL/FixJ family response regulator